MMQRTADRRSDETLRAADAELKDKRPLWCTLTYPSRQLSRPQDRRMTRSAAALTFALHNSDRTGFLRRNSGDRKDKVETGSFPQELSSGRA